MADQIRTYRVSQESSDAEVTLRVDHSILTPELAEEINHFWSGHEDRYSYTDDDHVLAVIKLAAVNFIGLVYEVMNDYTTEGMQSIFDGMEGWGGSAEFHGITLHDWLDFRPDLDSKDLLVEEVANG